MCQRECIVNLPRMASNKNLCVQVRHVTMISFTDMVMQKTAKPRRGNPSLRRCYDGRRDFRRRRNFRVKRRSYMYKYTYWTRSVGMLEKKHQQNLS